MASCKLGESGGLPNSVISAPRHEGAPFAARTPTLISGSSASFATPSMIAARTPTLMALTGGVIDPDDATLPRFSNLALHGVTPNGMGKAYKATALRALLAAIGPTRRPPSTRMHLAVVFDATAPQVIDGLSDVFGLHQGT